MILDKLTPEQKYYLVGLFQTDGCLEKQGTSGGRFTYEISSRDQDIVNKIYNLLNQHIYVGLTYRIRDTNFKKKFEAVGLRICNKQFRDELSVYVPYGSKFSGIRPITRARYLKDYWRGQVDGNGSLGITSRNRPFISLCAGSDCIKTEFVNFIAKTTQHAVSPTRNKRDGVYNILVFDEAAVALATELYRDSTINIARKYTKYQQMLAWKRSVPKITFVRKVWTPEDDTVITSSALTLEQKMKQLGRTKKSIMTRAWRLS